MIVVEVVGGLFNIGVALLGTGLMILMTASIVEGVKEWVEDLADRWAKRKYSDLYSAAQDLQS